MISLEKQTFNIWFFNFHANLTRQGRCLKIKINLPKATEKYTLSNFFIIFCQNQNFSKYHVSRFRREKWFWWDTFDIWQLCFLLHGALKSNTEFVSFQIDFPPQKFTQSWQTSENWELILFSFVVELLQHSLCLLNTISFPSPKLFQLALYFFLCFWI